MLTNVGDIYNELYDIYKSKYNKKINRLSEKDKKKLNYKQLRLSDNYLYSSEEEQEISRLPIALAQLEAGTNSGKLKNEIRQLLYSFYCSKNYSSL